MVNRTRHLEINTRRTYQRTTSTHTDVDELTRARDADVRYMHNTFPLLHLGLRRSDCQSYLDANGWGDTPRSACIGCPFHDDGFWHRLKTNHPDEWADACAFDEAICHGSARANAAGHRLRGTYYLHPSRVPLAQAVLRPSPRDADQPGCSPFACPSAAA
jgi:hypothetical protein